MMYNAPKKSRLRNPHCSPTWYIHEHNTAGDKYIPLEPTLKTHMHHSNSAMSSRGTVVPPEGSFLSSTNGLPADEHKHAQHRHKVSELYRSSGTASLDVNLSVPSRSSCSTTPSIPRRSTHSTIDTKSSTRLQRTQDQRVSGSQVAYATRKALSTSFDFTDGSCDEREVPQERVLNSRDRSLAGSTVEMLMQSSQDHRDSGYVSNCNDAYSERSCDPSDDYGRPRIIHDLLDRGHDGVVDMVQHVKAYRDAYGPHSHRKPPVYYETGDEKRKPVALMTAAVTPCQSRFSWDDDSG
ncbi:hypothetical protein BU24DRAFT_477809 [Aaosphaeria arxii CBS 175.79]|uniref:Uncharacterized protein n=1 Tax=Aaosphaeria arxii CBS 175.79 TaxID=1450172 RepID=A0A6A5XV72_9PLEO|nr:uncharacterized protein BU24DRAFT_477809 [Aaosphaeria arxii CBS 175.79]KAF2016849.1 hypothetical protein BU24DRAFT_477809 [Aaosphaeria arxii CBS 175.79]